METQFKIKNKTKRGVSAIVATVLLVLITVAAVGIVWQAIIPLIRGSLESSQKCSDAQLFINTQKGFTCFNEANNEIMVQIQGGSQNVGLVGMQLYVSGGGNSKSVDITEGGIIADDLIGYWDFNDGTAKDLSKYKNDGVINGATVVEGRIGKALNFNGADSIVIKDSESLDIKTNAFTTSFWIKPSVDVFNMANLYPIGVIKRPYALGGYANHFIKTAGVIITQYCWNGGCNVVYSSTAFKADIWYHISGTFDGSLLTIYVNGVLENSNPATTAMGSSAGTDLSIGNNWQGIIDEVKIWNRALSENEIKKEASGMEIVKENAEKTYIINANSISMSSPDSVAIAPIIKVGNKETICSKTAEVEIKKC